jgi:uncharacterized protein (DUF1810 family)
MGDAFHLDRFVAAQEPVIAQVLSELRDGQKRSHWMWFVFPQIRGLGQSPMAVRYSISSRAEAEAYLEHPVLGPRLKECTALVIAHKGRSVDEIFGYPDNLKFRSSMTLFDAVLPNSVFHQALDLFFDGQPDAATLDRL